jgi:hypothetical protein
MNLFAQLSAVPSSPSKPKIIRRKKSESGNAIIANDLLYFDALVELGGESDTLTIAKHMGRCNSAITKTMGKLEKLNCIARVPPTLDTPRNSPAVWKIITARPDLSTTPKSQPH